MKDNLQTQPAEARPGRNAPPGAPTLPARGAARLGAGLLGLALAILGASCTGPADQSEARLEREILKVTPLGTSMAEVKVYVAKQGWKITEQSNTKGFYDQSERWRNPANHAQGALDPDSLRRLQQADSPPEADPRPKLTAIPAKPPTVGQKHLRAAMGEFHTSPFPLILTSFGPLMIRENWSTSGFGKQGMPFRHARSSRTPERRVGAMRSTQASVPGRRAHPDSNGRVSELSVASRAPMSPCANDSEPVRTRAQQDCAPCDKATDPSPSTVNRDMRASRHGLLFWHTFPRTWAGRPCHVARASRP
jgi:hypothetical protein